MYTCIMIQVLRCLSAFVSFSEDQGPTYLQLFVLRGVPHSLCLSVTAGAVRAHWINITHPAGYLVIRREKAVERRRVLPCTLYYRSIE